MTLIETDAFDRGFEAGVSAGNRRLWLAERRHRSARRHLLGAAIWASLVTVALYVLLFVPPPRW
jgi:hypothetical protein